MTTTAKNVRKKDRSREGRRQPPASGKLLLSLVLALPAWPARALNPNGPLSDLLVDAAVGELSTADAVSILDRLNQLDLGRYSLNFSGGDQLPLKRNAAKLDAAVVAAGEQNKDLLNLTGPKGSLLFDSDEIRCFQSGKRYQPDLSTNAVGSVEKCLGVANAKTAAAGSVALVAAASGQSAAAIGNKLVTAAAAGSVSTALAASRASTIDLLISRPSSQFMVDVRRLVNPRLAHPLGSQGGGSGDGESADRWGVYLNSGGSFGDINTSRRALGFGIDSQFVTSGFDYRFSDRIFAGFLFNFSGIQSRFAQDTGSLNADVYRFMPFFSITPFENAYIDVMAGYGYQEYSLDRRAPDTAAHARYSADQALASINLGYTHSIRAFDITGYAGGSYIGTFVNGYGEQGRGTLLKVGGFEVSSWTSTVGLQLGYTHSLSFGVLKPNLRLEWIHEFSNAQENVQVSVPIQGVSIRMNRPDTTQDWGKVAAGVQAVLPRGITGYVNYEAQLMSVGENHTVEGGLRYEF